LLQVSIRFIQQCIINFNSIIRLIIKRWCKWSR